MARARKPIYIDKGVKIFLRPNSPYWQIQIWRGGVRKLASLGTSDVEHAKVIARQRADDALSKKEGVILDRDVTYDRMFENYKRHAMLRNAPTTRELNFRNLLHIVGFMRKRIGSGRPLKLEDFTFEALEDYATWRKKQGRKVDTINREYGSLSSLFGRAKKSELIRANPMRNFDRLPVARNQIPKTLGLKEVQSLLQAAAADVDYHGRGGKGQGNSRDRCTPLFDFLLFLLNTGARLSEAIVLEYSDIDFDENTIQLSNKEEHPIKTRVQRVVNGNVVVMKMLKERYDARSEHRWVFPSLTGDCLDRKNLLRELKAAARRAKISPKRVNFLIIRHTALTASAAHAAPFVLKEMAGHGTIRTTERYYIGKLSGAKHVPPAIGG